MEEAIHSAGSPQAQHDCGPNGKNITNSTNPQPEASTTSADVAGRAREHGSPASPIPIFETLPSFSPIHAEVKEGDKAQDAKVSGTGSVRGEDGNVGWQASLSEQEQSKSENGSNDVTGKAEKESKGEEDKFTPARGRAGSRLNIPGSHFSPASFLASSGE